MPAPKDISAEELAEIVALEDPTRYRVPLSIGPPHAEIDKSGKGCTVYDIIVHPLFYEKTEVSLSVCLSVYRLFNVVDITIVS